MSLVSALLHAPSGRAAVPVLQRLNDLLSLGPVGLCLPPGSEMPRAPGLETVELHALPLAGAGDPRVIGPFLEAARGSHLLRLPGGTPLDPVPQAWGRLLDVGAETGALMIYGDYQEALADGNRRTCPLAPVQLGSLEEGHPTGPVELWSRDACLRALPGCAEDRHLLWYDLRLRLSRKGSILHLPEILATVNPEAHRTTGEQVFDYLRADTGIQQEAERIATDHLEALGARVVPPFNDYVPFSRPDNPVVASVVIPVRNRVRTLPDALESALSQQVPFPFNVLVVDNHSTDGTSALLDEVAARDPRCVVVRPRRRDLGIGGCWNQAIHHPACGQYAVQLDSDDLYADSRTLGRMVALLRDERCGMAVGAYSTVGGDLQPIPPGLVDHREWSEANGPNNALRVGGLGAPRAFVTELVRAHPFPNISYGEDYAVALRLSRTWRVGRLYEPVYLCRRWEQNTDADLPPEVATRHRVAKDRLRTLEILARIQPGTDGQRP